jgi:hypothetical protein
MSHKAQTLKDYRKFTPTGKVSFGDQVISEIAAHPLVFITPKISIVDLTLINNTLRDLNTAAATGDKEAIQARDNYLPTWINAFDQESDYVDLIANGDTTILEQSGFHFSGDFASQVVPGQLVVRTKGNEGHGSIHFEADAAGHGANYLMIGVKPGSVPAAIDFTVTGSTLKIVVNGVELYIRPSTRRKGDVDGLTPRGAELNVVMAAFNSAGMGPVSEPSSVTIP